MRRSLLISTTAAILSAGCATEPYATPVFSYVTTYYDRNGDGRADYEVHDDPRISDEAWTLSDDNFDGRYDRKLKFGVVLTREPINQLVPSDVKLRRRVPPQFASR